MKTLVILDVDVEFKTFYRLNPQMWRRRGSNGFTSSEYFYLVDDQLAARLTSMSLFFSTGDQETVLDVLDEADARPFAVRSSGSKSFALLDMSKAAGGEDDQPMRVKAMIKRADEQEGVSKVYRFVHNVGLFRQDIVCVDQTEGRIINAGGLKCKYNHGVLKSVEDAHGNVVSDNPAEAHLARMYGYWLELDKEGATVKTELAAPPKEEIAQMKFTDAAEAMDAAGGNPFGQLFSFLAIRKDQALVDVANSWRVMQAKEFYQPVNRLGLQLGVNIPRFETFEQARQFCVDTYKGVVRPELDRLGSNVRGAMSAATNADFRIYLALPPGKESEDMELLGRELSFTPGRTYDLFTINRFKKKVMSESEKIPPQFQFWRRILSKIG